MARGVVDARDKVTVSLPHDLLRYIDERAGGSGISRSQAIAEVIAEKKAREEQELAAEGYRFYASESSEFAIASLPAVSEAIGHGG